MTRAASGLESALTLLRAQNVDSGAIMMQAFANRQAVKHTLTTGKARGVRGAARRHDFAAEAWRAARLHRRPPFGRARGSSCGPRARRQSACARCDALSTALIPRLLLVPASLRSNFINVVSVHVDCDGDSLIYMGVPDGPACHTVRFIRSASYAGVIHARCLAWIPAR